MLVCPVICSRALASATASKSPLFPTRARTTGSVMASLHSTMARNECFASQALMAACCSGVN